MEGVGTEEGKEMEKVMVRKYLGTWLSKSSHKIRLKPFQATFRLQNQGGARGTYLDLIQFNLG